MMNTFPVFSTFLSPEVLAAASVTRIAFLDHSPLASKPVVSSIVDISARARALAASDATASTIPSTTASATPPALTEPATMPTAPVAVVANEPTTATTLTVTHINPQSTIVDPFADAATFSKEQANSFVTAQAVAAYYLMNGFAKELSNMDKSMASLTSPALVSPVNPVARVAAVQLELHP